MRLYLDTNAIIFAHEGPPGIQAKVVECVIETCLTPGGLAMTSLISRLECRVRPLRDQNLRLLSLYDSMFGKSGLRVEPISADIIERATQLRADHSFRTPDAIHLATAIQCRADLFLTGDKALARCPGLHVEII